MIFVLVKKFSNNKKLDNPPGHVLSRKNALNDKNSRNLQSNGGANMKTFTKLRSRRLS